MPLGLAARATAALAAGDLESARRLLGDALAALGPGRRVVPLRAVAGQGGGDGEGG